MKDRYSNPYQDLTSQYFDIKQDARRSVEPNMLTKHWQKDNIKRLEAICASQKAEIAFATQSRSIHFAIKAWKGREEMKT